MTAEFIIQLIFFNEKIVIMKMKQNERIQLKPSLTTALFANVANLIIANLFNILY